MFLLDVASFLVSFSTRECLRPQLSPADCCGFLLPPELDKKWRVKKHCAFDLSKELTVLSTCDKAAHSDLLAFCHTKPAPASPQTWYVR